MSFQHYDPYHDRHDTRGHESGYRHSTYHSHPRDDRYSPPTLASSSRSHPQPSLRSRRRWPPQPLVEEEAVALRREAGARRPQLDEAKERGTIDQDPILIDVHPPNLAAQAHLHKKSSTSSGVPTPPTSDDEKLARGRRQSSRLDPGALLPEMRRAPSPYNFSSTKSDPKQARSTPLQASSSNAAPAQPPVFERRGTGSIGSAKTASYPMSDSRTPRAKPPSGQSAIDGPDLTEQETTVKRKERRDPYFSSRPALVAEPESMSPDERRPRPTLAHRPLLSEDNRRHTDSFMDVPRESVIDSVRKPTPLKVASLVREASGIHSPSSPSKPTSARTPSRTSPLSSSDEATKLPPSPPRSPRLSLDRQGHHTGTRRSVQSSAEGSRTGSRTSSPQSSPRLTTAFPATPLGWQHAFDSNAARTTRTTTLLANSLGVDEVPRQSRAPVSTSRAETLPYPVDDFMTTMPEERDHQYFPEAVRPVAPSPMIAKAMSRTTMPVAPPPVDVSRPTLTKHHSSFAPSPTSQIPPTSAASPRAAQAPTKKTGPAATKSSALPPCPRPYYRSGYTDWYTLTDCPNLDVCPHCVRDVFGQTYYRHFFVAAADTPARSQARIKCDFANPWMRLAWLLTLQRQLPNLGLLKQIYFHLNSAKPCPDSQEQSHQWYTIVDHETFKPLRSFHVCATDMRNVEILLPQLRGFFTPYPNRNSSTASMSQIDQNARLCSFRTTDNNRFPLYLDSIISLHEAAVQAGSTIPDMTPFTKLVKHKLDIDECSRDNIMHGGMWYFIPSLPEFTVCEDCHDDVIVPMVRADSDVALRFNRNMQHLPQAPEQGTPGRSPLSSVASLTDVAREASCSLYSPRMRKVLRRAAEDNDFKYLARKAKERKDAEVKLQRQAQPLIGRLKEIDDNIERYGERQGYERDVARWEDERHRLEEDLLECREEWADWE